MSTENPGECDGCHFGTQALTAYPRRFPDNGEQKWLCRLCESTPCGAAVTFPKQYPEANVLRTICYVGNVILAALEQTEAPRP